MLAVVLTEYAHRQTNQRTMGLWLEESFPAFILVLNFMQFSFVFGRLKPSGHDLTSRDRCVPRGSTNDGVVVRLGRPALSRVCSFIGSSFPRNNRMEFWPEVLR